MTSSRDTEKSALDAASESVDTVAGGAPVDDVALEAVSGGTGVSAHASAKGASAQDVLADNELAGIPVKRKWVG